MMSTETLKPIDSDPLTGSSSYPFQIHDPNPSNNEQCCLSSYITFSSDHQQSQVENSNHNQPSNIHADIPSSPLAESYEEIVSQRYKPHELYSNLPSSAPPSSPHYHRRCTLTTSNTIERTGYLSMLFDNEMTSSSRPSSSFPTDYHLDSLNWSMFPSAKSTSNEGDIHEIDAFHQIRNILIDHLDNETTTITSDPNATDEDTEDEGNELSDIEDSAKLIRSESFYNFDVSTLIDNSDDRVGDSNDSNLMIFHKPTPSVSVSVGNTGVSNDHTSREEFQVNDLLDGDDTTLLEASNNGIDMTALTTGRSISTTAEENREEGNSPSEIRGEPDFLLPSPLKRWRHVEEKYMRSFETSSSVTSLSPTKVRKLSNSPGFTIQIAGLALKENNYNAMEEEDHFFLASTISSPTDPTQQNESYGNTTSPFEVTERALEHNPNNPNKLKLKIKNLDVVKSASIDTINKSDLRPKNFKRNRKRRRTNWTSSKKCKQIKAIPANAIAALETNIKQSQSDSSEYAKIYDDELPFDCVYCHKRFKQKSQWRRHVDCVHLKIAKFECHKCGKFFKRTDHLKNHLNRMH